MACPSCRLLTHRHVQKSSWQYRLEFLPCAPAVASHSYLLPASQAHTNLNATLCAAVSARQAHLPNGGVLVSVDTVLRGAVAGESGLLVAAFLNETSGWNASTVVGIKAPGQRVITLEVLFPMCKFLHTVAFMHTMCCTSAPDNKLCDPCKMHSKYRV